MDIEKQIAYWRTGSQEDLEVGALLLDQGRFRHGLFFVHLALEKALKAHVVRATGGHPPKIHNLVSLVKRSGLEFRDHVVEFLNSFDVYQLEGRYPDSAASSIGKETARKDLTQAREVHEWLLSRF